MLKYWWDFTDDTKSIVVQSLKNPEIKRFGVTEQDQKGAALLVCNLEEGRIRVTSKDEIKE